MTLFQSTTGRHHTLLMVDLKQSNLEEKLWEWARWSHSDMFWDIEMQEGGSIKIDEDTITFSGDNGIFTLEAIEVQTI